MGLDMYLSVRKYVSQYDWTTAKDRELKSSDEYKKLVKNSGLSRYVDLEKRAGGASVEAVAVYWRKANAIHQWFVDNCADGVDDCRPVYVSTDHLKELLARINEALATPTDVDEILPTTSGFFFGSTEYDDFYWEDLKHTKTEIEKLLKLSEEDEEHLISFIYQASW